MLDESFPHKCPTESMTERQIWKYAGKRDLIDYLVTQIEEQ